MRECPVAGIVIVYVLPSGATESFIDSRGGAAGAIPLYTWDRNGGFEAYRAPDGNYVLRQQIDKTATGVGGAWNGGDLLVVSENEKIDPATRPGTTSGSTTVRNVSAGRAPRSPAASSSESGTRS